MHVQERLHLPLVLEFGQQSDLINLQHHRQFFQIHVSNLLVGNRLSEQVMPQIYRVAHLGDRSYLEPE